MAEIDHALASGVITLHTKIKGRVKDIGRRWQAEVRRIVETTPGRMKIGELLPKSEGRVLRSVQPADDQARHLADDRRRLPPLRPEGDGHLLRPRHGPWLLQCLQGRHFLRQGRHGHPGHQGEVRQRNARARQGIRAAIYRRPHHPGREVQQGRRCLGEVHRPRRRRDDEADLRRSRWTRRPAARSRSTRST